MGTVGNDHSAVRSVNGSFSEKLAAAAVSLTGGKCTVRACPYHAEEGSILCGYHQRFFSYESYLFDRSIEEHYRNLEDKFTADGLVIKRRSGSRQTKEERVIGLYHQILGSAGLLADALKHIREAPPSQIIDWSTNHFAAQELIELSRYPGKRIICPYCGRLDVSRSRQGFLLLYRCRLCKSTWSLTTCTILSHRLITLDKWVHALCLLQENHQKGVITELTQKLCIGRGTAGRLNHRLCLCAETLGLRIGWPGNKPAEIQEAVRQKLGLSPLLQRRVQPSEMMTVRAVAAHFGVSMGIVGYWIKSGKLKNTRFHQLNLVALEDVASFKPPIGTHRGRLVPAEATLNMVRDLRQRGFTRRELQTQLGRIDFHVKHVRSSTEQHVKTVYEHLIKETKTPRLVSSEPAKALIQELWNRGIAKREIARALGKHSSVEIGRRISVSREQRIRKVYDRFTKSSRSRWAPSAPTRQLVDDMLRSGFTEKYLARRLGIWQPIASSPRRVRASIARKVERLYKRLMSSKTAAANGKPHSPDVLNRGDANHVL